MGLIEIGLNRSDTLQMDTCNQTQKHARVFMIRVPIRLLVQYSSATIDDIVNAVWEEADGTETILVVPYHFTS